MRLHLQGEICLAFTFITKNILKSFCFFFICMFVSFLLSETSPSLEWERLVKKTFTYALQMKLICDHKFTEGTEIRQAATLSWRMCTAVYPRSLPAPTPCADLLSSPSGILLFNWWKRLLGSCTNELALLLLNDVCKLWPSLLPMNGAETQNLHHQLKAHSQPAQLVKLKLIFSFFFFFFLASSENSICSSLAHPCGVKANTLLS